MYLVAVCQRYLHRTHEALGTLAKLEALYPDYPRLYQEQGHCHRLLGNPGEALRAYELAVRLDGALHASWIALRVLYGAAGRATDSAKADEQLRHLAALPPDLVSASSLMNEGDLQQAEIICRRFLLTQPLHSQGMRLLAELAVKNHVLDDAEFILQSCVELCPTDSAARYEYATVLAKRQKFTLAKEQAVFLRTVDRNNVAFAVLYATQCASLGDHEEALSVYQALLVDLPGASDIHLSVGHTLKTLGRQAPAIEAYRAAYQHRPDFGEAYWSLANLKTYRFTDTEVAQMGELTAASDTVGKDRYHLHYALAKSQEDRGDYAASFANYERGDLLKRQELRYDATTMHATMKRQATVCTSALFRSKKRMGSQQLGPIFIVGLPRAGSTLLEQILASHSQVDGTMELPFIPAIAHALDSRMREGQAVSYPEILGDLGSAELTALGDQYLEEVRPFRQGAPFFVDKMPNNFRHIGLIHLILPNAKIIDARRDPMACCFSCYKQLFAEGQEFTYGLRDIGRYYSAYVDLMTHWDAVLPDVILRVDHKDVVDRLDYSVRRMLDFCGLGFEQACVEFHKTDRSVRTASSEQVRQPIYRDGLEHWRHFEPYLGSLKSALTGHTEAPAEL